MSKVFIYRNGYLEIIGRENCYELRYYRNEKNKFIKNYKCKYNEALTKFKKAIDTEGF